MVEEVIVGEDIQQNQTLKHTEAFGIVNMEPNLRRIDPTDEEDIRRMRVINEKSMDGRLSDQELKEFVNGDYGGIMYGVSGSESNQKEEWGELQGWVYFHAEDPDRLTQLFTNKILTQKIKKPVTEIVYARNPETPSGQMAKAIAQSCIFMLRDMAMKGEKKEKEELRNLEQIESPEEKAKLIEIIEYEYAQPYLDVIAYIETTNKGSIRVAEEVGFIRKGVVTEDDQFLNIDQGTKTSSKDSYIYVLDWNKLHNYVQLPTDSKLAKYSVLEKLASASLD